MSALPATIPDFAALHPGYDDIVPRRCFPRLGWPAGDDWSCNEDIVARRVV